MESSATRKVWLVVTVCGLAWAGMIAKFVSDWGTNAQYEFGYFVPLFIIYLLLRRWQDRPDPSRRTPKNAIVWAIVALAVLLPLRLVQEANPDWRPLNFVHGSLAVALGVSGIALIGGSSWVRHFSIPLFLIFFAIPWPLAIEQGVIQSLTSAVTRMTVEFLNLANIPALQRGNVIEVASGPVGVADACSGIRSLAGTLMAAAFFGEFYRFSAFRRIALILCGAIIAFGLNLCRTFFLSSRAAAEGVSAVSVWHDRAGYTIFVVSFALLWILARALSSSLPPLRSKIAPLPAIRIPQWSLVAAALWVVGVYVAVELWYRAHERSESKAPNWVITWPQTSDTYRESEIPEDVRSILRYTEGNFGIFEWPDGPKWQMFLFKWDAGRSSSQLATMHRPEICMPAAGFRLVSYTASFDVTINRVTFPFSGSVFEAGSSVIYVFRCLWEDQPATGLTESKSFDMSFKGRVMSAVYGKRNLGQRLIQIGISGVHSEEEAREDLRRRLSGLITISENPKGDPKMSGAQKEYTAVKANPMANVR